LESEVADRAGQAILTSGTTKKNQNFTDAGNFKTKKGTDSNIEMPVTGKGEKAERKLEYRIRISSNLPPIVSGIKESKEVNEREGENGFEEEPNNLVPKFGSIRHLLAGSKKSKVHAAWKKKRNATPGRERRPSPKKKPD